MSNNSKPDTREKFKIASRVLTKEELSNGIFFFKNPINESSAVSPLDFSEKTLENTAFVLKNNMELSYQTNNSLKQIPTNEKKKSTNISKVVPIENISGKVAAKSPIKMTRLSLREFMKISKV